MDTEAETEDIPEEIINDPFKIIEFSVPWGKRKSVLDFAKEEFLEIKVKNGKGRAEIPSRYLPKLKLLFEANSITITKIRGIIMKCEQNKKNNIEQEDDFLGDNDPFIIIEFSVPWGKRKVLMDYANKEGLEIRIKNRNGRAEIPLQYLKNLKLIFEENNITINSESTETCPTPGDEK